MCSGSEGVQPVGDASNNRLSSADDYVFDTTGNTTNDPQGRTFIYDAENKQIEVKDSQQNVIGQYRYDGDGKRVKKVVPSAGEVTVFVYSAGGQLVAEYSTEISQDHKVSYTTAGQIGDTAGEILGIALPGPGKVKAIKRIDETVRGNKAYAKDLFRIYAGDQPLVVIRDKYRGNRISGVRTANGSVIYRPKGGKGGVIANVEVINPQRIRINIHIRP